MKFTESDEVINKIKSYPKDASKALMALRQIIISTAQSCANVSQLSESTKWGEPSYASNCGTPVRIDWKESSPDKVHIYVSCNTVLLETYKELYDRKLNFIGKREIALDIKGEWPKDVLVHCIELALNYKKIRKLSLLGN